LRIYIESVGLAAFIKMQGCNLLSAEYNKFEFESIDDANTWNIAYINSCCARHDAEVCNLRRLIKK